jgi:hypothetical protein
VPKWWDATNDEAGEGARLICRCTSNVFSCLKVECGAECVEVNAIRTRDESEDTTHSRPTLNGKDETLDDLANLDAEGGRRLCGGCCGLCHGARLHRDPHGVARRHHSLRECTTLR